jgi:outer membrane protein OmpA-like peptidoglycan-associated protein
MLFESASFAVEQAIDVNAVVKNLGDSINSAAPEYYPTIGSKDSLFVFARKINGNQEDFFESNIINGQFSNAIKIEGAINKAPKKGGASFSKDFKTIYFAAEYPNGVKLNYGRFDIYKSTWLDSVWSDPVNLGRSINTDFWESAPSISADGKALYFCSNRPDGFGGIDIYVSHKNAKGYWEPAENLGPTINTAGDEQTPVIFSDNKTLYFSSNGLIGYGGADLFASSIQKDGSWSTPINLGYPINTYDNEGSIAIAPDGKAAYIASDRKDSRGALDIYKIDLPVAVQPASLSPLPIVTTPLKDSISITLAQTITFKNLRFATNTATIQDTATIELQQLASYLKNNPTYLILIEGHTDNSGLEKKNGDLSIRRAEAVKQYLIQQQIASERITTKGWGASKPVAPNNTPQGRALNRRTTFIITIPK